MLFGGAPWVGHYLTTTDRVHFEKKCIFECGSLKLIGLNVQTKSD
jgi:hypothetical protein